MGFLASCMQPWLSHMMDVAPSCTYPTSANSCRSQIASFVHWLVAIYSASVVDNAMVGCFLHFHEMAPRPTRNTYPVVDRRSLVSPAQCASQNPTKDMSLPPRESLSSKLPSNTSRYISRPSNATDQPWP